MFNTPAHINTAGDVEPSSSWTYDRYGTGTLPVFHDTYLSYNETLYHIYLPFKHHTHTIEQKLAIPTDKSSGYKGRQRRHVALRQGGP
jgi:hypothetical protein